MNLGHYIRGGYFINRFFLLFATHSMDATMPGQYQLPTQYYPPTTTGGDFLQNVSLPNSDQNHAPLSVNEIYEQYHAQTSTGSSSYQLNSTLGNFAVNPMPLPASAWSQPSSSSSSHIPTFDSHPFVNEFASNPSTNLRDEVWSKRNSHGSVTTFKSRSSGKRPRQEPEGSQRDSKKMRLNSPTDSSSAVLGSNMEVQSGSIAKPPCRGYRTVMLCNDELRKQLQSSPGEIPTNSRLFFLAGFPIVAHINQPLPSPEEIIEREKKARRGERSTGVPLTTEETEWLVNAYSHQSRSTVTPHVLLPTSERVDRSDHDTANAAPTPHQFHHQPLGHRNQDLYVDGVGQNALPNHTQPASLQREQFQVPGSMIMMHGTNGSSQSPQYPPAVGSGFLDPSSSATYDETAGWTSNWTPQATGAPVSYPPSAFLANQGNNFVVQAGANESNPTLITPPSREGVDNLMGHGYVGSVPRPFQVFQGSDSFETLSKTTTEDDDDKSLFGAFTE
ncbi:hypothetical protein IW261DRAFT_1037975 [Armillaria novae-zelandiae]|uniref:Uncharacterized protein n=1 Tax=Armillaria novae-zelandiae TaxID=153914 RepID=A0AA39UAW3_9AGAR|nr:hypothetical protein IW261DRAFT_1037975 [Armillaria novae-zelandiae]